MLAAQEGWGVWDISLHVKTSLANWYACAFQGVCSNSSTQPRSTENCSPSIASGAAVELYTRLKNKGQEVHT